MSREGDYIVYVDESGDHGLASPDPQYPVFVLAYCIFRKQEYTELVVPAVQALKFAHFGHDLVVLHEREIRKAERPFDFGGAREKQGEFMADLSEVLAAAPFTLIATCIRKDQLKERYARPTNPYHLALAYGLERLWMFLSQRGQRDARTHVVFECRGRKEDRELKLEFQKVCAGHNYTRESYPFEVVFADKRTNSSGLQLADMVARPIGRHVMNPEQRNRAFEVLRKKFDTDRFGGIEGCGLKCFP